jgi:hypothetical protein
MLLFALAATSPAHRVPWLEKWLLGVNKGYFGVDSVREKLIIVSGFFCINNNKNMYFTHSFS